MRLGFHQRGLSKGEQTREKKTFLSIIDNLYINKERGKFFFLGKLVILIY